MEGNKKIGKSLKKLFKKKKPLKAANYMDVARNEDFCQYSDQKTVGAGYTAPQTKANYSQHRRDKKKRKGILINKQRHKSK